MSLKFTFLEGGRHMDCIYTDTYWEYPGMLKD
jgi:hypothetical protein